MKILVLSPNFAPRGSSCSVRSVHFVKYLSREGHAVRVVTYDETTQTFFLPADAGMTAKVPTEVGVVRVSPGPLRRLLMRRAFNQKKPGRDYKQEMKGNPLFSLLIPDPQVDAVLNFIQEGARQMERFIPDVLLTHAYPFSINLVGAWLKWRYPKVKWIADYGDPWSGSPLSELTRPAWRKRLDYRLERFLLRLADHVTVTTEATQSLYSNLFPDVASNISVLPMGFDPEDFNNIQPVSRSPEERGRLWLVYTGRLYSEARDPLPFVTALSKISVQDPSLPNKLRVILVGEVEDSLKNRILSSPVKDLFAFVPWVPVDQSIAWMKAADFLLLFGNRGDLQIPGKIYQYLGARRPIFMTSLVKEDPTARIALGAPGSVVVANNSDHIFKALSSLLSKPVETTSETGIEKRFPYAWPQIVKKFIELT